MYEAVGVPPAVAAMCSRYVAGAGSRDLCLESAHVDVEPRISAKIRRVDGPLDAMTTIAAAVANDAQRMATPLLREAVGVWLSRGLRNPCEASTKMEEDHESFCLHCHEPRRLHSSIQR